MLAILALASGAALLYEPFGNLAFTKFSLALTEEAPAPAIADAPRADAFEANTRFLAPDAPWSELITGSSEWFPTPIGMGNVGPFADAESLLATVRSGAGECSTWTEGFMMMCTKAGRRCREWANIAEPDSPASGHAVVEVWLPDQNRWAMLDVFVGIWARGDDGLPLSALEFEEAMMAGKPLPEIIPIGERIPNIDDVNSYYGNQDSRLVQIVNNDPLALTDHWTRAVERLNKPLGQLLQRALGVGPRYYVTDAPRYDAIRPAMERFRFRAVLGLACLAIGGLILSWVAGAGWVARTRRLPRRAPRS